MTAPHVVILLENLPVTRDRRVWREACALRDARFAVTTICPRSPGEPASFERDGVEIRTFPTASERSQVIGFVWEYAVAWAWMLRLLLKVGHERRIDGVQACNPPDIFFLHGLLARLKGAAFVFDQHDLAPELYETRFGRRGLIHRILRLCERLTYRAADRVVATNDSYKAAAIERGRLRPDRVVVVRNGPDPDTMRPGPVDEDLRSGRDHLVVWMGNMGPQDGVDDALRAVAHLVHELDRHDCSFAFIGQGEVLEDLRQMACDLDIEAFVTFTGWIPDCDAFALLSSATIGLSADPPGPLNDKSTMNKTLEYMAFGLPVVAHDLAETRVSAGDAALYASTPDPKGLALAVDQLLDDPRRRQEMGRTGRDRIECGLSWSHQEEAYTRLWAELVGLPPLDPPSRV